MTNEQIIEYTNYVMSLAQMFEGYKSKEDLFQVGCIGLMDAYSKYNPDMNVKFTTFAYYYIVGEMKKLVRTDKGIKISRDISKLNLKIEKAKVLLSQKLMRIPTNKEIANFLEIEEELVNESQKIINILSSIDEPIYQDGKEITLHDYVEDKKEDIDTLVALKQELSSLSDDERKIIEGRYVYDYTQTELADILGMTQVQVSRKEKKIKEKIKEKLVA